MIDFVDWYVGKQHWPTFNFADAAITSGVVLLMLEWLVDALRGKSAVEGPAEDSTTPAQ